MALRKQEKSAIIETLKQKIKKAKIVLFANFSTLKVGELTEVRKQVKENEGEIVVAKKTLFHRALKEVFPNTIGSGEELPGEIAFIFGYGDELIIPKITAKVAQQFRALKIIKGLWHGGLLSEEDVKKLSSLPSRPEILGRVLYVFQTPIRNFEFILKVELVRLLNIINVLSRR